MYIEFDINQKRDFVGASEKNDQGQWELKKTFNLRNPRGKVVATFNSGVKWAFSEENKVGIHILDFAPPGSY